MEVLIGIAVIVIALLGVFGTFTIVTSGILNTKENEQIAMKVLSELEHVEAVPFDQIHDGTTSKKMNETTIITTIAKDAGSRDALVTITAQWLTPKEVSAELTMTRTKSQYGNTNAGEVGGTEQ